MRTSDVLKLPPGVLGAFLVLIWPAVWAAASLAFAFAGDVVRHRKQAVSGAPRKAA